MARWKAKTKVIQILKKCIKWRISWKKWKFFKKKSFECPWLWVRQPTSLLSPSLRFFFNLYSILKKFLLLVSGVYINFSYEDLLGRFEEFSCIDDNFALLLLIGAYMNSAPLDGLLMAQTLWSPRREVVRQMTLSEKTAVNHLFILLGF